MCTCAQLWRRGGWGSTGDSSEDDCEWGQEGGWESASVFASAMCTTARSSVVQMADGIMQKAEEDGVVAEVMEGSDCRGWGGHGGLAGGWGNEDSEGISEEFWESEVVDEGEEGECKVTGAADQGGEGL